MAEAGGERLRPAESPGPRSSSGRVTDTAGAPLVGVNILIQGTATGVVSGSDGGFSIRMPEGRDNLIFSHIGYVSQTLPSHRPDWSGWCRTNRRSKTSW